MKELSFDEISEVNGGLTNVKQVIEDSLVIGGFAVAAAFLAGAANDSERENFVHDNIGNLGLSIGIGVFTAVSGKNGGGLFTSYGQPTTIKK